MAYGNLQIFVAAIQGVLTDCNTDRKLTAHYTARAKLSLAALVDQFAALRDLLAGSTRGYMCLDTFHSRVLAGKEIKSHISSLMSELNQVPHPLLCCTLLLLAHA